MIYKQM